MSYNKNGLEIKLDFEHSLNTQNLEEIKEPENTKIIENNITSFFFPPKPKEIPIFQKYSDNFIIISKHKKQKVYIITKISKFELINNRNSINNTNKINNASNNISPEIKEKPKEKYEIINIDKIKLINTKNELPPNEIIPKEKENGGENINNIEKEEKKLFLNLNISNENTILIQGNKKTRPIGVQMEFM